MNKKNGFTLVELLAVVIILALTFMFVDPKMVSLIKEGNNNEVRLIEQKALVSAKNYVNNYDTNFLNNFIEVGHTKTVYKEDLIDNGLMTLEEIEQLEDFRGVQVKLLENDKLEYTISRLSNTKDYTNEELLQMINKLKEQVNSNNTNTNIFLKSYPVGSIYISTSSTNPGSTYGGTWVQVKDKFLLAAGDIYEAGSTGGEATHTLTISEMPGHSHVQQWYIPGVSDFRPMGEPSGGTGSGRPKYFETSTTTSTSNSISTTVTGDSKPHNNMPPYVSVYIWERIA